MGERNRLHGLWIAAAVLLALAAGCHRAAREPMAEGTPPGAPPSVSETATTAEVPGLSPPAAETAVLLKESSSPAPAVPTQGKGPEEAGARVPPGFPPAPEMSTAGTRGETGGEPHTEGAPKTGPTDSRGRADAGSEKIVVSRLTEDVTYPQDGPPWARWKEELVYRVEFLGITMGYARFSSLGKVLLSGREAYHLRVRAWTSDLLSVIYPVDDTIDYYLDVETIAPLRQEHQKMRKEDDVATYDQEKGTIVYRYRKNGKIRKRVDAVPNVYDPVSVAYYFRTRNIEGHEDARSMYAGRKLWEISAKAVGFERIRTDRGEFDTIVVEPVLRREGKVEKKGDLRMWMTRDERHLPVRLYAKFKKIRTWTLVGELLADPHGG